MCTQSKIKTKYLYAQRRFITYLHVRVLASMGALLTLYCAECKHEQERGKTRISNGKIIMELYCNGCRSEMLGFSFFSVHIYTDIFRMQDFILFPLSRGTDVKISRCRVLLESSSKNTHFGGRARASVRNVDEEKQKISSGKYNGHENGVFWFMEQQEPRKLDESRLGISRIPSANQRNVQLDVNFFLTSSFFHFPYRLLRSLRHFFLFFSHRRR